MISAPIYRRWLAAAAVAAVQCLWAAGLVVPGCARAAAAPAADFQDVAQIAAAVREEALHVLPPLTAHQRLVVGPLTQESRLQRCAGPLRAAVAPGLKIRDRAVIELRCDSGASWRVFVPVRIAGTAAATVTTHTLVVGSVLGAADVRTEERDLTQVPPGYFDDAAAVVGLTVARPVAAGAVLTNQQLLGIQAVQKGQTVTLVADAGGLSIRMAGRALSDGLVNQRIQVQNLSSGKVVEGIARSAQVVEIVLQ
jgi:flagella basal body P-ring formation protein FlgA